MEVEWVLGRAIWNKASASSCWYLASRIERSSSSSRLSETRNKQTQPLSSSSLTPQTLCSIQVRDRALVIDLRASRASPPSPLHLHSLVLFGAVECFMEALFLSKAWSLSPLTKSTEYI
ncbi:hypothetical protein SORBI_3K044402 [Sorghum bicolor]|uniref:Uncharacterized protein n=1 Tax=Sorghum bicolor TaxID=4558 RepID=A0A1W0VQU1_SORBI|nr:hypothetical protein SORBI_3K044402 [Sorghum bicolor]